MRTMLTSLLIAGLGVACCQSVIAAPSVTSTDKRPTAGETQLAWTSMAGRSSNAARGYGGKQNQQGQKKGYGSK